MHMALKYIILIIGGYLLGCLSFARILSKIRRESILAVGSGNPGSMNMLRTYGALYAGLTLFFDAVKAAVPAIVGFYLLGGEAGGSYAITGMYVGGGSAVLGHIYPVFYKFKGGKGIASTMGLFAVVNPLFCAILFAVFFIFFYFVKIGSLASLLFIYAFAIYETVHAAIIGKYVWWIWLILWFIVFIDSYAHRQNLKRIFNNTERITSFKDGVQKDIERIKTKKQEKIQKMENKTDKIEDKYNHKITTKEEHADKAAEKIELKKQHEIANIELKLSRIQRRYDKKVLKIKHIEKEMVNYYKSLQNVKNDNSLISEVKKEKVFKDSKVQKSEQSDEAQNGENKEK